MWIRLLQHFRFPEEGYSNRGRMYSPGHVRQVSDADGARILAVIAGGRPVAEAIRFDPVGPEHTAGVLTASEVSMPEWADSLGLEMRVGTYELPWDRNVLWNPTANVRAELIPRGIELLDKWELAACVQGDTVELDGRLVFIRGTEDMQRIVETWRECGDLTKAINEAQPKPLCCYLPAEWLADE